MRSLTARRIGWLRSAVVLALATFAAIASAEETALDRYIAKPDEAFAWQLVRTVPGEGYVTHVLELVSQQWRSAAEVDRPLWKHWLTIVRPDKSKSTTAFLFIGGGSNRSAAPERASERVVRMALGSGTVVAELGMVPNQPLYFTDQPEVGRSEDDLVAYSRVQFIETGDPEWLVRLPMVKSGVRAMDAIQQFMATEEGGELQITDFVVAGGSKRGWTTWLVGVVDPRVVAIVPIVIDALNTEACTRHHFAAYGFFSPALHDYVRHGLYPDKVGTPEFGEILRIEDPYRYRHRERLAIPKYVINSAGDQFFTPDNSQFYYHDMPDEKLLRYVPNTKHDLAGSDAQESILAFYQSVLDGAKRPQITWRRDDEGTVRVATEDTPTSVRLWQATNPRARDFRLDTIGKAYHDTELKPGSDGVYVARVEVPREGFTAFFVEATFAGPRDDPLKVTTDVFVIPDVLPFEDQAPGGGLER